MKSWLTIIPIAILFLISFEVQANPIFEHLNVAQCDSLITAQVNNPNFVILDVRTANEHNPNHLEGAININYYAPGFSTILDTALNKNKTYLIHCASGGRSGAAYNIMQGLGFQHVYNMLGGMNSWGANSYPTTTLFAPQLMVVNNSDPSNLEVEMGGSDLFEMTITNRANDTLEITGFSDLSATEFSINIDTTLQLLGSQDYTFSLVYAPVAPGTDTILFELFTNGGSLQLEIIRTAISINPFALINVNEEFDFGLIAVNQLDSMEVIVSNVGIEPLTLLESMFQTSSSEFSTDFINGTVLENGMEYHFYIFYQPIDFNVDSAIFQLMTNAQYFEINLTGSSDIATEIESFDQQDISVFPNPASDWIQVNFFQGEQANYAIRDVSGRIIKTGLLQTPSERIMVNDLKANIYFLELSNNQQQKLIRFIKL